MRRYAVMQKARDSDVFGILVGTLGVGVNSVSIYMFLLLIGHQLKANYLPLISHLRSLIRKAQRKFYTISVGKLNPAKLANFPEIECFVLVACPENSIVESKVSSLRYNWIHLYSSRPRNFQDRLWHPMNFTLQSSQSLLGQIGWSWTLIELCQKPRKV